jgi:hypothetical protein
LAYALKIKFIPDLSRITIFFAVQYHGPPELTRIPENATTVEGECVEFHCHYISGKEALVQWVKHYTVNGSYWDENKEAYINILKVCYFIYVDRLCAALAASNKVLHCPVCFAIVSIYY